VGWADNRITGIDRIIDQPDEVTDAPQIDNPPSFTFGGTLRSPDRGQPQAHARSDGRSKIDMSISEADYEFVAGTLKNFAKKVLEIAAEAHGLGLALNVVEFAVKADEWLRVAEGDGTVEISAPIPLDDGVELELSAHPAK
jgi:hypothetical protein